MLVQYDFVTDAADDNGAIPVRLEASILARTTTTTLADWAAEAEAAGARELAARIRHALLDCDLVEVGVLIPRAQRAAGGTRAMAHLMWQAMQKLVKHAPQRMPGVDEVARGR